MCFQDNFPLVRYLPAPEDQVAFNQAPTPSWLAKYPFPYPPVIFFTDYSMVLDGRLPIYPPFASTHITLLATFVWWPLKNLCAGLPTKRHH